MLNIRSVSDELYEVSDLLLEDVSRQRFWLFDLEATGLDTSRERVTQIAGIPLEGGRVVEEHAFTQYVRLDEGVEIPKVVQDLTGITRETLDGAPSFPDAWERHLAAAGNGDIWVGQSVFEFDVPLLQAEFERHGMPVELPPTLDSVAIATALLGQPEERWSTTKLLQHFRVDTTGLRRHDALDDVKILGRILLPMLDLIRTEHGDRLEIPADKPVRVRRHPPVRSES
jgi:DNA polymerase III epsilon subunit-like protein